MAVQHDALREAERAITWETGLPQVDVRLVHAAVTGAQIGLLCLTGRASRSSGWFEHSVHGEAWINERRTGEA